MEIKRITRKEFESFPKFEKREEAIKFLEEKYGDYFIEATGLPTITVDDIKVYPYLLIINKEDYLKLQDFYKKTGLRLYYPGEETRGFSDSNQRINIYENGRIQVIDLAEE
ncbi:hypothetical protein [Bacillus subtilis]|uniref:hypothetical protein n=1 Tax=Bacillus subtilis TaxID=1423 RepID=UPI0030CE177C